MYLCQSNNDKLYKMNLPEYLIADHSALQDDIFVLHTQFPRFLLNVHTDEIEWLDEFSQQDAKENADVIEQAVAGAYDFFEKEMENYED